MSDVQKAQIKAAALTWAKAAGVPNRNAVSEYILAATIDPARVVAVLRREERKNRPNSQGTGPA